MPLVSRAAKEIDQSVRIDRQSPRLRLVRPGLVASRHERDDREVDDQHDRLEPTFAARDGRPVVARKRFVDRERGALGFGHAGSYSPAMASSAMWISSLVV